MDKNFLFETPRCTVRYLQMKDIEPFHILQSNPAVMRFVRGAGMTREENEKELPELIEKYSKPNNDFWIFAIERNEDQQFIGTFALVKDDDGDDELGYRFIEDYWGQGYGYEICLGLIDFCRLIGMDNLVGYVAEGNTASAKILEKCGFGREAEGFDAKLQLPDTKYRLYL